MVDRISSHEIHPIEINVRKRFCVRLNATNFSYGNEIAAYNNYEYATQKTQFKQQESRCLFMHIKFRSVTFEFVFFPRFCTKHNTKCHTNTRRDGGRGRHTDVQT